MKNLTLKKIILSSITFLIGITLLIGLFIKLVAVETEYYIKPITAFKNKINFIEKNDIGKILMVLFRTFTIINIVVMALLIVCSVVGLFINSNITYKVHMLLVILSIVLTVANLVFAYCFAYDLLMFYNNTYKVTIFAFIPLILVVVFSVVYFVLILVLKEKNQQNEQINNYKKYKQAYKSLMQYKQLLDLEIISQEEYQEFKTKIL